MADGRDHTPGFSFRAAFPWMDIFRCFTVALDPRKLLVAAAGILAMSVGWYVLSAIFYYKAPDRNAAEYGNGVVLKEYEGRKKPGTDLDYTPDDAGRIADERYATDLRQWYVLADLAGPYGQTTPGSTAQLPPGRFRALPWDEYRGPNPFIFATNVLSGTASERGESVGRFVTGSVPVLTEPLVKLLVPVAKLVSPGVSTQTRFYLFTLILWNVAVWAFFGGVITRLAAVQLANKGPISLRQAVRFVCVRYLNYLLSPLIPLAIIGAVVAGLIFYGLLALIPFFGDIVLLGLLLPLVLIGGAIMAVFLVGLVGYPLMYPTLSVEGDSSDTFDALSRSINYVYQSPWHYVWYWLVAIVYGAAVTFFVLFFTSLSVYMAKWAVGIPAGLVYTERKPEYLFVYAPESFGWKELLLADSPYAVRHVTTDMPATGRKVDVYQRVNEESFKQSRGDYWWYNNWGAGIVGFWLALVFLMMLGFSYSFFWTAATAIYFLMRKRVDEADPDEVFLEEDEPEAPLAPPKLADGTSPPPPPSAGGATPLTVITAPPAPPMPPPVVVPPPRAELPPIPLSPPPLPPTPSDTEPKRDGDPPA